MSSRIAPPATADGAAWLVYDHLAALALADPGADFSAEQTGLIAFYDLRTQVNSDGFEGYFSYEYGDDAPAALWLAGRLDVPGWPQLIADALALIGEPYPQDQDDRSERVDDLADAGAFTAFDDRFYKLEAEHQLDAHVDRYVWARPAEFFS